MKSDQHNTILIVGASRGLGHAMAATFLQHGWEVVRTPGGHLKFTKPGLPPIYTGSTASDFRAERNARAQLRRAVRHANASGGERHG